MLLNGWTGGWMDRKEDGWIMDGWWMVDGWRDGWTDGWVGGKERRRKGRGKMDGL